MTTRLDTRAFTIASATVSAAAYLLGALLHVVSPWGAPAAASYVFRVDVIDLSRDLTWDSFVVGALLFTVTGGALGGFCAWVYNRLATKAAPASSTPAP